MLHSGWFSRHFVTDDEELLEGSLAEVCGQGNIRGVAPPGHNDPTDARNIVSRIECVPAVAEIDFEPAAEIHRKDQWHADVSHVAGNIAGRNVHAATERNGEMTEIAADAMGIVVNVEGGFERIGEVITKGDVIVDPIAN